MNLSEQIKEAWTKRLDRKQKEKTVIAYLKEKFAPGYKGHGSIHIRKGPEPSDDYLNRPFNFEIRVTSQDQQSGLVEHIEATITKINEELNEEKLWPQWKHITSQTKQDYNHPFL